MILPSSFRDPRGFVFRRDGVLYRQVSRAHAADYDALMESGLYERLVEGRLLIPHAETDVGLAAEAGAHRVLRPELVPFVSYPYEWSFLQLRDAALATLEIQSLAMDHGLSLRDASAFNVTFHRGRPTLLDTTSFERRRPGEPWVAYRQFCQHFLAPLALMAHVDVRLGQLARLHIDGVPLDLATTLLPARASMRPGLAMHLRMHARSQRRHERDEVPAREQARSMSERALRALVGSLGSATEGLIGPAGASVWRSYEDEACHYGPDAAATKERLVAEWIDRRSPRSVWDLGANTGRISRVASSRGIDTVAFDLDPFCVDEAYRVARAGPDPYLLPLVVDLANPSPGIGWGNHERETLAERGPADLVLALALLHHLAITNNVPLDRIAEFLASLGRSVIVEWIPKDDVKVRGLLRHREDVFDRYDVGSFEAAVRGHFAIVATGPVGETGRVLYLLDRRGS